MSKKVVTFGENYVKTCTRRILSFCAGRYIWSNIRRWRSKRSSFSGKLWIDASFVTKLPTHEIGQAAVNSLRKYGVDTSKIARGGDRVGIYFLEKGASQRPSKVIYDRAGSSIYTASKEDFNWKEIFEGAEWFHLQESHQHSMTM